MTRGALPSLLLACLSLACGSEADDPVIDAGISAPIIQPVALGAPDTALQTIRNMAVGQSVLWLAALGDVPLAVYARDGSWRRYPISRGDGPDQLSYAASVEVDASDRAIVWDGLRSQLLRFDTSGAAHVIARSEELKQRGGAPRWDHLGGTVNQVASLSSGVFLGRVKSSRAGSADHTRTAIISLEAGAVDTLLHFAELDSWLDSISGGSRLFGPYPIWQRCGRDRVAVFDPRNEAVTIMDSAWRPMRTIKVGSGTQPRTDSLARALFYHRLLISTVGRESLGDILQRIASAPPEAYEAASRTAPRYVNLICTPSEVVLLQLYQGAMNRMPSSSDWEMYHPSGRTDTIAFAENFTLMAATDSVFYGLLLDEFDVPTVAAAPWPSRLLLE